MNNVPPLFAFSFEPPHGRYSTVGAAGFAVIEFDVQPRAKRRPCVRNGKPATYYLVALSEDEAGRFRWNVTHRGKTTAVKQVGISRANSLVP